MNNKEEKSRKEKLSYKRTDKPGCNEDRERHTLMRYCICLEAYMCCIRFRVNDQNNTAVESCAHTAIDFVTVVRTVLVTVADFVSEQARRCRTTEPCSDCCTWTR